MKFRSVILLITVFAMIACVFTGCNNEPVEEENSTLEAVETVGNEEPSAEVTTVASDETTTQAETTTAAETTTKSETTTAEKTTKAETTTQKSSVNVANIASSIAGNTGMFEETLVNSSSSIALDIFGIPSGAVAEASYYVASAAVAEEVLVVRAASASDVSTIVNCIEARRSMQMEDYADYVPKEVPKLESAVVYTSGDCVVFCVSNNNSAMRSIISGLL